MAICRVIPPANATMDYDYLAFTFDGKNSYDTFGIVRTGDGDRYNEELLPTAQDITAEVTSGDGMYFFNTRHKQKVFNISFAFDGLNDAKVREMRQWLDGKKVADLWFAENPYKVYSAKVTGQPNIKFIPFDELNANGQKVGRIYKGEGSIQFTCYWPYAHTPDYVGASGSASGKIWSNYSGFNNKNQWGVSSGLARMNDTTMGNIYTTSTICKGENPGDLPAPFLVTVSSVSANTTLKVGTVQITIPEACTNLQWDSKTGMVVAKPSGQNKEVPINFTGNSCGTIPVGGITSSAIDIKGGTIHYHYWYY